MPDTASYDVAQAGPDARIMIGGFKPTCRLVRFPLREIAAVLVCKERNCHGWLTIVGANGWSFGSVAEARKEARWLSVNTGLPIREIVAGGAG